jgi:hypothetical protein
MKKRIFHLVGDSFTGNLYNRQERSASLARCRQAAFVLKGTWHDRTALSAGALLPTETKGQSRSSRGKLSPGDVALLQFALWASLEAICGPIRGTESDLQVAGTHKRTKNSRDSSEGIPRMHWRFKIWMATCRSTSLTTPMMN